MSQYHHFTMFEREKILFFRTQNNKSIRFIAKELGRSPSSVSREIRRNSVNNDYSPSRAEKNYKKRRKKCHRSKLLSNPVLFAFVSKMFLEQQWSPEEIAGRLSYECSNLKISFNTIYRAIYAGMFDTPYERRSRGHRGAIRKLRHKGKTRHKKGMVEKRGKIKISNPIEERPEEANNRSRIGDWEADSVMGKTGGACLVTLVDRRTLYLKVAKVDNKDSRQVRDAMIHCLTREPCFTITPDRGKEFSKHAEVTAALNNVPFYFPKPHQPWKRGRNENTNGLLREYFPKGCDLNKVSHTEIQQIVDKLNKRPRKTLGYRTPFELYHSEVLHLT